MMIVCVTTAFEVCFVYQKKKDTWLEPPFPITFLYVYCFQRKSSMVLLCCEPSKLQHFDVMQNMPTDTILAWLLRESPVVFFWKKKIWVFSTDGK